MVIAGGSFLIFWSGTRWIVQPHQKRLAVPQVAVTDVAPSQPSPPRGESTGNLTKGHPATIADLLQTHSSLARDHALAAELLKLDADDLRAGADEMLALLIGESGPGKNGDVAEAWMDRWLELDAPGALQFLSRALVPEEVPLTGKSAWSLQSLTDTGFGGVIRALARREPEWTRQMLAKAPPGKQREVAIFTLLEEVAKGGAAGAASYLEAFSDGPDRSGALTGYITGLITNDVRAGFERAWAEPPGALRSELLRLVFSRAGESDLAVLSELLERVDDHTARRECIAWGLRAAPREDALPLIQQESERMAASGEWETNHFTWLGLVEGSFGSLQAQPLAEWALNFQPDKERKMFAQIARSWAGRDPAEFQRWLSDRAGTLDPATVDKLAEPLASLAAKDVAAARAWSDTLPPGSLRDQARFQIALRGGASDLAYAAAAYQPLATTDTSGALAAQLADILAGQDCAAAGEWALQQTLSAPRLAALRKVGEAWTGRDPVAATQWLGKLPPGPERDAAVSSYASVVVRADPEGAAEWAELVAAPTGRTKTAVEVYYFWSKENPAAARTWFRNLEGVDEEAVPAFLKHLR